MCIQKAKGTGKWEKQTELEMKEMKERDLPGHRGKVERGIEQHRQLCKPRAHMTRRDQKSRQRQFLADRMRMTVLRCVERRRRTIFLDSAENVVDVVGEEPFCVEHSLNQASNRSERHLLSMRVFIPLRCQDVSVWFRGEGEAHTSRRCLTFFTNMFPSAANPFTARTARSVLSKREESKIDIEEESGRDRRRTA